MPAEPAPFLTRLPHLDAAWAEAAPGSRLAALRRAARGLHDHLTAQGAAVSVRTYDLVTFPYPTRFGLGGVALTPVPFVMLRNRMMLVQVMAGGALVNILVNPTDAERSLAAPFFARQLERYGSFVARRVMSTVHGTVPAALAAWGLGPDEIDYITFDHLHVQDLRGLLGTGATPALLPRARLLVQQAELDALIAPHPLQRTWYVEGGIAGVAADRIVVLDGDYRIGAGFAVVRTPGHTRGNHSPVLMTDRGLWTVSENGVACDAYAPESSHIAGLRRHARETEEEVVLNANTREASLDQYTSMVLEKSLADPCPERPEFPQHFPSSEMVRHPLAPGLAPTYSHGAVTFGQIRARSGRPVAASA
jgi:glyoxylase-like metal-dependent hydrolase (beta-lactamase superfamily II)